MQEPVYCLSCDRWALDVNKEVRGGVSPKAVVVSVVVCCQVFVCLEQGT